MLKRLILHDFFSRLDFFVTEFVELAYVLRHCFSLINVLRGNKSQQKPP